MERSNVQNRRDIEPIEAWYTHRDLADGSDLGSSQVLAVGNVVCLDIFGVPTGDAFYEFGFKVTKPQTENVRLFGGIVTRMSRPQSPSEAQLITIQRFGPCPKALTKVNMTGNNMSTGVPPAAPTPLAPVADEWHLAAGLASGIDTPAELTGQAGFAVETVDTSTTAAFKRVYLAPFVTLF